MSYRGVGTEGLWCANQPIIYFTKLVFLFTYCIYFLIHLLWHANGIELLIISHLSEYSTNVTKNIQKARKSKN